MSRFTGPVITAFTLSHMTRPNFNFYAGTYHLQSITPCAKRGLAMQDQQLPVAMQVDKISGIQQQLIIYNQIHCL